MHGLAAWYADLILRIKELESWTSDFSLPASVWLPGFFNPQSFLTAIMQSTARKNELPLDKMSLACEVTKVCTYFKVEFVQLIILKNVNFRKPKKKCNLHQERELIFMDFLWKVPDGISILGP